MKRMDDILQQMLGINIEYIIGIDEMKIKMVGANDNYYAELDEIIINPKIVDFHDLEIKKSGVNMDLKTPIICNTDNINLSNSMMIGIKSEGKDKNKFIEKIDEIAKSFGPEWEEAVHKRKDAILARSINNSNNL